MKLAKEKRYFDQIKGSLLKNHEGQFALIKGYQLIDIFPDAASAFKAGAEKFGGQGFLVTKVEQRADVTVSPLLSRKDIA